MKAVAIKGKWGLSQVDSGMKNVLMGSIAEVTRDSFVEGEGRNCSVTLRQNGP